MVILHGKLLNYQRVGIIQRILVLCQESALHMLQNVTYIVDRLCCMLSSVKSSPTCEHTLSFWGLLWFSLIFWQTIRQCGAPVLRPVMFVCKMCISIDMLYLPSTWHLIYWFQASWLVHWVRNFSAQVCTDDIPDKRSSCLLAIQLGLMEETSKISPIHGWKYWGLMEGSLFQSPLKNLGNSWLIWIYILF